MNCEQFLFEVSYLLESGEHDNAGSDVSSHLRACSRCHARFEQLKQQYHSKETAELTPLMSQRLHQRLDLQINDLQIDDLQISDVQTNGLENDALLVSQRLSSPKVWLQMAFTCLILVGAIVGIAYQDHPTATPPVFARR
jgi:hypothetical protein